MVSHVGNGPPDLDEMVFDSSGDAETASEVDFDGDAEEGHLAKKAGEGFGAAGPKTVRKQTLSGLVHKTTFTLRDLFWFLVGRLLCFESGHTDQGQRRVRPCDDHETGRPAEDLRDAVGDHLHPGLQRCPRKLLRKTRSPRQSR
jgi:hypothetical protein